MTSFNVVLNRFQMEFWNQFLKEVGRKSLHLSLVKQGPTHKVNKDESVAKDQCPLFMADSKQV